MIKLGKDNIMQYHRQSNNCFQDVLGMILVNNGINPLNMYIGCLNFGYKKEARIFGERITPSRDGMWLDCTISDSVFETSGMVLQKKQYKAYKDLEVDLEKSEQGIILEVDVYDCEWHIFFRKIHSLHYCWLIGVENNKFICALPFGEKIGSCKADINSKYNYYVYDFVKTDNEIDCLEILSRTYTQCMSGEISDLEQMYLLRNDVFKNGIDLEIERDGYPEVVNIPLVRALEWVLWSRMNYHDMLTYYDKRRENNDLILEIKTVIDIWKGIKNFVIIEFMREHNVMNAELVKYLDEAIEQETVILKKMKALL